MRRVLRLHDWWGNKVPPMLAAAYLSMLAGTSAIEPVRDSLRLALLVVATLGIGGIGYVLTDAFDVEEDRRAGKANGWGALGGTSRVALVVALLVIAAAPWLLLTRSPIVFALLALEMALFVAYAVPPIRLKERGFAGIVVDAMYAHVVPVAVAWLTFAPLIEGWRGGVPPACLALWMLPIGMRHLARHQYDDLDRDRLAGVCTFATRRGRERTMRVIVERLLPADAIVALATMAWFASIAPLLLAGFVAHVAWELYVVRRRWLSPLPAYETMSAVQRHDLYGQRILSGFVERWLSPLALLSLALHDARALWLLPLHLLVAGAPLGDWWRETRALPRTIPA